VGGIREQLDVLSCASNQDLRSEFGPALSQAVVVVDLFPVERTCMKCIAECYVTVNKVFGRKNVARGTPSIAKR
jgi:hypothetical protein